MDVLFIHISIPKTNCLIWTLKLRVLKEHLSKCFELWLLERINYVKSKAKDVLNREKFWWIESFA